MEVFIGTIFGWAPNFAPMGWMFCQGQVLSISQYTAVFALVGTTYGGNGVSTFGLPNLQARIPVGAGQGPGTSNYVQGQVAGTESTTLTVPQLAMHNHVAQPNLASSISASTGNASLAAPSGSEVLAKAVGLDSEENPVSVSIYAPSTSANTTLQGGPVSGNITIGLTGGSQPVPILQPFQVIQYIFCVEGLFPPRN